MGKTCMKMSKNSRQSSHFTFYITLFLLSYVIMITSRQDRIQPNFKDRNCIFEKMTYSYEKSRTTVIIAFVKHLLHLILTTTLLLWYYYYAHFTEEKSETDRLSNLSEVIELRGPGTRIQYQEIWFQNLNFNQGIIVPGSQKVQIIIPERLCHIFVFSYPHHKSSLTSAVSGEHFGSGGDGEKQGLAPEYSLVWIIFTKFMKVTEVSNRKAKGKDALPQRGHLILWLCPTYDVVFLR